MKLFVEIEVDEQKEEGTPCFNITSVKVDGKNAEYNNRMFEQWYTIFKYEDPGGNSYEIQLMEQMY